ncbi:MAG: O-antigen ligase domain-containing protein [Planctomycetota bacterium]
MGASGNVALMALLGWPLITMGIFSAMSPRRAVLTSVILGWLFLPEVATLSIKGIPDYDKSAAIALAVLLSTALFDPRRIASFKANIYDLPMILWILGPFATSISNGLGAYDGVSACIVEALSWGIPYFMGRVYFSDQRAAHDLAVAFFLAGLLYVPFCLWEVKMHPHLHKSLYGFRQQGLNQTLRLGGYRPTVFLPHGIAVGMLMTSSALCGYWLWISGGFKKLFGVSVGWMVVGVAITAVLCKSTGAIALLIVGAVALAWSHKSKSSLLIVCMIFAAPSYITARALIGWDGVEIIELSRIIVNDERAASLKWRIDAEDLLVERAEMRAVLGWGRWRRWRVYDERGRSLAVSDGFWIIAYGQRGLVGLVLIVVVSLLPIVLVLRFHAVRFWRGPGAAGIEVLSIVQALYMIDYLFNFMLNPIVVVSLGAVISNVCAARMRAPTT